jgi:hypothetical protein
MTSVPVATTRHTFDAQELVSAHPPRFRHTNKRTANDIACPPGSVHAGRIEYSRWPAFRLPAKLSDARSCVLELRAGYFGYERQPDESANVEWYLNFAASDLFCAYSGGLFAQDELQVAEHPALASLREALCAEKIPRWTVEKDRPTPIVIAGVERRCQVALDPNAKLGRPAGLYGNAFSAAKESAIIAATTAIEPPTITNVLAIEAPPYGTGAYSAEEIKFVLTTAYSGFAAASAESSRIAAPNSPVVIHTGFWGCGAYGGNRVLMTLLQMIAARLAGINSLVFHYGTSAVEAQRASAMLTDLLSRSKTVSELIGHVESLRLEWGTSDGN